jgi:hypothetical protein
VLFDLSVAPYDLNKCCVWLVMLAGLVVASWDWLTPLFDEMLFCVFEPPTNWA